MTAAGSIQPRITSGNLPYGSNVAVSAGCKYIDGARSVVENVY